MDKLVEKAKSQRHVSKSKYPVKLEYLPLVMAFIKDELTIAQVRAVLLDDPDFLDMDITGTGIYPYCLRVQREGYFRKKLGFDYEEESSAQEAD